MGYLALAHIFIRLECITGVLAEQKNTTLSVDMSFLTGRTYIVLKKNYLPTGMR